jgi:glutaredoxin 3
LPERCTLGTLSAEDGTTDRMAKVVMYTTQWCPFCVRAKALLKNKGVPFEEVDVSGDDVLREKMIEASGRRTVPQIFIDDEPIGGFEELAALDREGELDRLLAA